MRVILAAALLLTAASTGLAQSVRVGRIDIVDTGIYSVPLGEQTQGANTPSGTISAVTIVKNIEATTVIPGKIGTEFGPRYLIVSAPEGAEVTIGAASPIPRRG